MNNPEPTLVPHSRDAEEAVVGSILINPNAIYDIDVDLQPSDFFIFRLGRVYDIIKRMGEAGESVDILTVNEKLTARDNADGIDFLMLSKLVNDIPTTLHIGDYARVVKDKSRRRRILEKANELARVAYNAESDLLNGVAGVLEGIETINASMDKMTHICAYTGCMLSSLDDMRENPKKIWGLSTGFPGIDRITGGIQKREVFLISGKPGVGKSLLAGQMAVEFAKQEPGAYFSLEMDGEAIARRMVSGYAQVPTTHIKTGMVDDATYDMVKEWADYIAGLPLFINKEGSLTLGELRAALVSLKRRENIGWFVLDYLMMVDIPGMDEIEMTGHVTKKLKEYARNLNLACILIHSLNKQGEERGSGQVGHNVDTSVRIEKMDGIKEEEKMLRRLIWKKGRELTSDGAEVILSKAEHYPRFVETTTKRYSLK